MQVIRDRLAHAICEVAPRCHGAELGGELAVEHRASRPENDPFSP